MAEARSLEVRCDALQGADFPKSPSMSVLLIKEIHNMRVEIKYYLGQNEDCSTVDSTSDISERLFQRDSRGRSICKILEGNGIPLQYSCLENPMDRGAWWAAVHGVAQSRTRLSDFTFTFLH